MREASVLVGAALPPHFSWVCCNGRQDVCSFSTFSMTGSSLVATSTVSMQFSDRASTGSRNGYARLRGPAKLMRSWYSDTASVPCSIDVLNRALRLEPSLGQDGSAVA